jgi:hypothetical protein
MEQDHDFGERRRDEAPMRRPRITDTPEVPVGDLLAGVPGSRLDAHDQESLWFNRERVHNLERDFSNSFPASRSLP